MVFSCIRKTYTAGLSARKKNGGIDIIGYFGKFCEKLWQRHGEKAPEDKLVRL